jgi:hypothetical protein
MSDQSKELQHSDDGQSAGEPNDPPIGRRFVSSILLLLAAFGGCLLGGKHLYNNRSILAATLFSIGRVLGTASFVVWWLLSLPETWGWWL